MEPEHLGAFTLVIKDNQVLLGKRINAYKSGTWGAPGGRLELTEKLDDCIRRELNEEVGIQAIKVNYVGVIRELQGSYNFIHFVFTCTEFEGKIINKEPDKCDSWEWFELDKLPAPIMRAHKEGIEMYLSKNSERLLDLV